MYYNTFRTRRTFYFSIYGLFFMLISIYLFILVTVKLFELMRASLKNPHATDVYIDVPESPQVR